MSSTTVFRIALRIHCVGIGGIGVSAVARMLAREGKRVTGSDAHLSPITDALRKEGIRVAFGHRAGNLHRGTDLVIYTKAIAHGNPELVRARRLRIPCLTYAEALGEVSRTRYTIAVSGAHGKTTTTAMVGRVLRAARLDPTVIVGGVMADVHSNFIAGRGKYLVAEACEYKRSFLDLHPRIIVITNIDNDHLDYYRNLRNIQRAFREFIGKLGKDGTLICNPRAKNLRPVVRGARCRIVDYTREPMLKLAVFGRHNIANAQAALAVARVLGIAPTVSRRALAAFRGVSRRFEFKGTVRGIRFYDDYAHHPTEVRAALRAAREHFGKRRRVWVVFQPHLYSRTRLLMNDFARAFDDASHVLLADIYAARERDDGTVHARDLAARIARASVPVTYLGTFEAIAEFLRANARRGDVVITMGAGEAYRVFDILRKK
jgi:UDP-N-acetylmuramate--alanine ligase